MDSLKKVIESIESNIVDIKAEITKAEDKGFVYARSKNIRAFAQNIKLAAQDLRIMTNDEFKKTLK